MGRPFGLPEKLREPREGFCCAPAGGAFLQNAGGGAAQSIRRCRAGAGRLPPEDSHCQAGWASGLYKPRGGWKENRLWGRRWAFSPRERAALSGENLGRTGENRKNRRINVYIISGKDNTNPPFQMGGNRVQWRQNTPAGCRKEKGGHHHESIDA